MKRTLLILSSTLYVRRRISVISSKGPIPGLCIYLNPLVPAVVPTPCLVGLAVRGHEMNRMGSLVTEGAKGARGGSTFPPGTSTQLPTPQTALGWQLYHFPPQGSAVPLFPDSCLIAKPEEAVPRSGPLAGTASLRAAPQFPALTGTLSY